MPSIMQETTDGKHIWHWRNTKTIKTKILYYI